MRQKTRRGTDKVIHVLSPGGDGSNRDGAPRRRSNVKPGLGLPDTRETTPARSSVRTCLWENPRRRATSIPRTCRYGFAGVGKAETGFDRCSVAVALGRDSTVRPRAEQNVYDLVGSRRFFCRIFSLSELAVRNDEDAGATTLSNRDRFDKRRHVGDDNSRSRAFRSASRAYMGTSITITSARRCHRRTRFGAALRKHARLDFDMDRHAARARGHGDLGAQAVDGPCARCCASRRAIRTASGGRADRGRWLPPGRPSCRLTLWTNEEHDVARSEIGAFGSISRDAPSETMSAFRTTVPSERPMKPRGEEPESERARTSRLRQSRPPVGNLMNRMVGSATPEPKVRSVVRRKLGTDRAPSAS